MENYFDNLSPSRPDHLLHEKLYIVTPVFNPQRYRSRWKLYKQFENYILNEKQAHLVTVECTFGNRTRAIVEDISDNHTVIHVQSKSEIWTKESLINLGIQSLPQNWTKVAWMDADIKLIRPDWVGETLQQLEHYSIIQMFQIAIDLDAEYVPFQMSTGFVHDYINGVPDNNYYTGKWKRSNSWHTGYAWAATRTAISDLGGLIDWAILGSADNHMARCLVGEWEKSVNNKVHPEYKQMLQIWQERAEKYIKRNIGYMKGGLVHYFHGAKSNRRYKDRWQILVNNQYQPSLDLKKDWNGIWQLTDRNPKLRDEIRQYFVQRNEDSIENNVKGFF